MALGATLTTSKMTSLTYLIYKENEKTEPLIPSVPSTHEHSLLLFSSFRKKSKIVDSQHPVQQLEESVNATPPDFPKLRDLILNSGIQDELDCDVRSIMGREVDGFEEAWNTVEVDNRVARSASLDSALKDVIQEVLSIDEQEHSLCTRSERGAGISRPFIPNEEHIKGGASIPPSRGSKWSSFDNIPQYCNPLLQPDHLTPTSLTLIPEVERGEETTPIFWSGNDGQMPSQLPSMVNATDRRCSKGSAEDEADDMVNSSHFPPRLFRMESGHTYKTVVSELTLPLEMKRQSEDLKLDPRAPQFRIAMEQSDLQTADFTTRTNDHTCIQNHSDHSLPPPPHYPFAGGETPDPPRRKGSQEYPTPKTSSYSKQPLENPVMLPCFENTDDFSTVGSPGESDFEVAKTLTVAKRKGTISASGALQAASTANPSLLKPEIYPGIFSPTSEVGSDHEESVDVHSIVGPFVSPAAVHRKFRALPNTPRNDSNPLLFPQGIECYPPSPTMSVSASTSSEFQMPERANSRELETIPWPMGTADETAMSMLSSGQHARKCVVGDDSKESASISFRARLWHREIICMEEGEERVHSGFYSGPINKFEHMHGNGVFWFDSGDVYLGQFEDDMLHGVGVMTIQMDDGSKHVLKGRFRCNEFVGKV